MSLVAIFFVCAIGAGAASGFGYDRFQRSRTGCSLLLLLKVQINATKVDLESSPVQMMYDMSRKRIPAVSGWEMSTVMRG